VPCRIEPEKKIKKWLEELPKDLASKIRKRLEELSVNPVCEKQLKGRLSGVCRARVGSYRIVYVVAQCTITVVRISKRESIYEELR